MTTPAPADHPIHDLIKARYSPRLFSARAVEANTLHALFEAARWAPSSFNEQPWRFVYARREQKADFERILDLLVPANQAWAHTAPILMVSVARLTFERSGKTNRHAYHDVGLACGMMAVQAAHLGMGVHMMSGFDVDRARQALSIPEGFDPVAAIAIGYPETPANMTAEQRERAEKPRLRKPISEFAYSGTFGQGP